MTFEIGFLFAILAVMVYLFLTEKIPVDLTAFAGLALLVAVGYILPDEAFTGFSSPAVITMLSIFIISAALLYTGVADFVGGRVHALVGGQEVPLILTLMLVAGVLSAFMNNIAATAVLMPAVTSIARRSGLAPSRLFMPLAFGAILGGTTTLVGTPPNILAGSLLREHGLEPFELFDFTPYGLALLAVGMLFMATIGRRLLPKRPSGLSEARPEDPSRVYRLHERLFSIRLPESSELAGRTLGETRLGTALGVQVVAVVRNGRKNMAPGAETRLEGGDVLLVQGRLEELRELLRMQGLGVEKVQARQLPKMAEEVSGVRLRITGQADLAGHTLRQLGFRKRYGLVVVGIHRDDQTLSEELADLRLQTDDRVLALGHLGQIDEVSKSADFEVEQTGIASLLDLRHDLFLLRIPPGSPLVGRSLRESRVGELVGLTVGGLIRGGETHLAVEPEMVIEAGDALVIAGPTERILPVLELGDIELETGVAERELEDGDFEIIEATIAPRSQLVGQNLAELRFRDRYGLQVLALWRQGRPVRTHLAQQPLQLGDALLLQGPRERAEQLSDDTDFVLLTPVAEVPRRKSKAPFAVGGLLLMVALVVAGLQPIHVAAFTAATLTILTGALKMREAYRAIEWRAIFLVAAVLPVGSAMERTGAAELLAESVGKTAVWGPYAVLASLILLSSLLSQGLDGAPAVVLMTPVVIRMSEQLGLSPYPLMMGVSLAASAAFMTPFSHKANLLVMGAGGYRSMDYLKVGTPLTIVLLALMVFMIPLFMPFG